MGPRPDSRQVPRLEPDPRRRGPGPQGEVAMRRVDKQRVGDEAVFVLARHQPLGKALLPKQNRLAGSVPVEVAVERAHVAPAMPTAILPDSLPFRIGDQVAPEG
jgi:hypothetical protein